MERFAARSAERFPFLHPDKLRDGAGVRPGRPGYNPRTLQLPPNWFKNAKISPGQQQWWEFKAKNFDSVCLFKMGKFYEVRTVHRLVHVGDCIIRHTSEEALCSRWSAFKISQFAHQYPQSYILTQAVFLEMA